MADFPLRSAILLAASLLTAACGESGREVVVYTAIDQIHAEPVLRRFQERTGIRVKAVFDVEAAKTTGLVNRLIAEKERPLADVFWNNEVMQTLRLKDEGVLAPFVSPLAAELPPNQVDPDGMWLAYGGRSRVFIVNRDRVPAGSEPRRLDDLLSDSRPGDRIGFALPLFGTTFAHAAALYALDGPEKGRLFFERMKARGVRVVDGNSTVKDLVADGQLDWGMVDNDDAEAALRAGAPVTVIAPDQQGRGTFVLPASVALVRHGPNPEAARMLIDFLASAEAEAMLVAAGYFLPSARIGRPAGAAAMVRWDVSFDSARLMMPRVREEISGIFVR